jgi:hypothetical protein
VDGLYAMIRSFALIFYLALVAAGIYLNFWIYQPGAGFKVLAAGSFLILFGGYLFWLDFLSSKRGGS